MSNKLNGLGELAGCLGIILFFINLVGLIIPLRSPVIDKNYADFARPNTLEYQQAMNQLEQLDVSDEEKLITDATRIFHYGMAHIPPDDIESNGFAYYRMQVPIWENYLLYLLSYIKPDTYRDYEFCNYRKALKRGTGRCGQQSMALVGYLAERGLETGFLYLGGHTLGMAKTSADKWYMLDPDYGGVIPDDLKTIEASPEKVIDYYWSDQILTRGAYKVFDLENNRVVYGGPDVRWGVACPIERIVYILKWLLPIILLSLWIGTIIIRRKNALTKVSAQCLLFTHHHSLYD